MAAIGLKLAQLPTSEASATSLAKTLAGHPRYTIVPDDSKGIYHLFWTESGSPRTATITKDPVMKRWHVENGQALITGDLEDALAYIFSHTADKN
jgi:hypothetical protein